MDLVDGEHWMISTCIEYSKENEPQIPRALVARGYIVEKWFSIPKKPAAGGYIREKRQEIPKAPVAGGYIREKRTGNTQEEARERVCRRKVPRYTQEVNYRWVYKKEKDRKYPRRSQREGM